MWLAHSSQSPHPAGTESQDAAHAQPGQADVTIEVGDNWFCGASFVGAVCDTVVRVVGIANAARASVYSPLKDEASPLGSG